MRKECLLVLAFVSGSLMLAQSPIILSNANMPGNNDTLRYTNVQINSLGNYQEGGPNKTWDFSNVVSTSDSVRSFKNALQTPYALFFLAPGEFGEKIADNLGAGPITLSNYYNYYRKQTSPNAFVADGVGLTINSVPVPSYYSDKDELYFFPLTYPQYDSSTFKFKVNTGGLLPVGYSKAGYRVTVVDGWGTVTTPYGSESCLRLITTQYSTDTIAALGFPVAVPNYVRSYQWLTTNSKIPYMEITGNLVGNNFTITQARYRGYPIGGPPTAIASVKDISAMEIYPNPVKDKLFFRSLPPDAEFKIRDTEGRLVCEFLPSPQTSVGIEHSSYLDVSELAPGLYVLQTSASGETSLFKFIKIDSE